MTTFAPAFRKWCLDLRSSHHTLERADASIALYSLNGALDEWLSQRSAKPSTPVRIG